MLNKAQMHYLFSIYGKKTSKGNDAQAVTYLKITRYFINVCAMTFMISFFGSIFNAVLCAGTIKHNITLYFNRKSHEQDIR